MDTDSADDPKIIDCPQCSIKNPIESDICYNCGAPLHEHEPPAKKAGRPLLAVVLFVLFVAGVLFFYYRPHSTIAPSPKSNLISEKKPVTPPPERKRLPEKAAVVKAVTENETNAEQINIQKESRHHQYG